MLLARTAVYPLAMQLQHRTWAGIRAHSDLDQLLRLKRQVCIVHFQPARLTRSLFARKTQLDMSCFVCASRHTSPDISYKTLLARAAKAEIMLQM